MKNDDSIRYFNDYDLLKIISCLTLVERISVAGVCQRWKDLVDESFRRVTTINCHTVLGYCRSKISFSALALIVRKCRNVKHIDLKNFRFFSRCSGDRDLIMTIAGNSNRLETINLDQLSVSGNQICSLVRNCKLLQKFASKNVPESLFYDYIVRLPNLRSVDLSGNNQVTGESFHLFGPKIEELYLNNCYQIANNGIAFRGLVCGNGRKLKKFSIINSSIDYVPIICRCFKNLTHLRLCLIGISCDFSHLSQLKHLISLTIDTYGNDNFIDKHLCALLRSFEALDFRELEIYLMKYSKPYHGMNSLKLLETCCPRIEKLVLRDFKKIKEPEIAAIATLKNLRHLDLMNSGVGDNIKSVIAFCPLLCYLNLHNCKKVGNKVLVEFIEKCETNPKEWHTLDIINTKVGATDVGRNLPKNLILLSSLNDCKYLCIHESPYSDPLLYIMALNAQIDDVFKGSDKYQGSLKKV